MIPRHVIIFQPKTVKTPSRLVYRIRQFKLALLPPRQQVAISDLMAILTPTQLVLFKQLQVSEQWHAYRVMRTLVESGQQDQDLLRAALLHDIGKILSPLTALDRAFIVLVKRLAPRLAESLGQGKPQGLFRPLVVASQHATWGADLVTKTGASPLTVDLVRRHEQERNDVSDERTKILLKLLQESDNAS